MARRSNRSKLRTNRTGGLSRAEWTECVGSMVLRIIRSYDDSCDVDITIA